MDERERRGRDSETKPAVPERRGHELVVVWGDELRAFELPAVGSAAIGRAEGNQIRIDHESVSRWHAVLKIGDSLVIQDLGAANGTFVPDKAQSTEPGQTRHLRRLVRESAELGVGDSILLGAVSAVVRRFPVADEARAELGASSAVADLATQPGDPMLRVHEQAGRAAVSGISVLILGETGVGKEVMARAIHARSPRARGAFLGVNCAAFSEQLLEGELFGYERGAFTGAVEARPGLFEAADGGTVFLDEVGELPLLTQAKLLRVLEDRSVMRLGARKARAIDVRFVAATNRDLDSAVQRGSFRQDLFYRLDGISLTIPPLRERPTELEPLVRGFMAAACRQLDRRPLALSDEALRALSVHDWPGNVRELKNAIDRAVVLCPGDVIGAEHLPAAVLTRVARPAALLPRASPPPPPAPRSAPLTAELDPDRFAAQISALERARIVDALDRSGGNQTQAAKLLGIARRTLIARLDAMKLPRPRKNAP